MAKAEELPSSKADAKSAAFMVAAAGFSGLRRKPFEFGMDAAQAVDHCPGPVEIRLLAFQLASRQAGCGRCRAGCRSCRPA